MQKVNPRQNYSEMEKNIIEFWKENKIFEKSVQKESSKGEYVFYDGPPFITGLPHYATLLPSIAKDLVCRYWTMKGYSVPRNWGWDCHGLPAENKVEKELGLKNKKEIEEMGVGKFVDACRDYVSNCSDQWGWYIDRIGRWVDMDDSYKTMDLDFMESIIWSFKKLHEKGLIYEGYRSSLHCPRCATPLSKFEITMDAGSYKDVEDESVTIRFHLKPNQKWAGGKYQTKDSVYILAWTTTPWTLPGNLALAVGKDIKYTALRINGIKELLIVATDRINGIFEEEEIEIVHDDVTGEDLVGLEYEPLFDLANEEINKSDNVFRVYCSDHVSTEDGTGVVHIAPNFGEEDFDFGQKNELPLVELMDETGMYTKEAGEDWQNTYFKKANKKVLELLENDKKDNLFRKEKFKHSYPHCYRCDTPLIYKAQKAWYLKVDEIRSKLLEENDKINWVPEHFKDKRFKYNLENAPDWCLSRSRYWGTPIPVWRCDSCDQMKVLGSLAEIEQESGKKIKDLHRPGIDEVDFDCDKCEGKMKRIPEILDVWYESGAMPFAQFHYPFGQYKEGGDGKLTFPFPADYIYEYTGQLRGWFYCLHVLSNALFDSLCFKNVVVSGVLAGTDGRKMSKSYGNYPDPKETLEKYGADALRLYFMGSPIVSGEDMSLSEKDLAQIAKGPLRMLWNSYSFFVLYASIDSWQPSKEEENKQPENLLDKWILSELNILIKNVDKEMEDYKINKAARYFPEFIDNLSNWYIRRSRRRFWKSENDSDKIQAYGTLWKVLVQLSKVMAPFCPFISEEIYRNLTAKESVHLEDYPASDENMINEELNQKMALTRKAIELGLSLRAENSLKVRQPLNNFQFSIFNFQLEEEFLELIKDELNVKKVENVEKISDKCKQKEDKGLTVGLDVELTEELKQEGEMRELVRQIQEGRKKADFEVDDRIIVTYQGADELFSKFKDVIAKEVLAEELKEGSQEDGFEHKIKLAEIEVTVWLKKA